MPQSSLRSAVYRSLVSCDDPNGVVENKTIRKSKKRLIKIEQGVESQSGKNESISSSSLNYKEENCNGFIPKGVRDEVLIRPSSFEVSEVSRGAQRLNEMIDSWSKGAGFDGQSNDIARDLLKGALDLQESLAMLCKLQEESNSNYKQSKKVAQGSLERNGSNKFTEKKYPKAFQNPTYGASKDYVEELRTVIKESLFRQNLLPTPSSDGKFDSVSDIPSTSSSQSSVDWSVSSGSQRKKTSLIAKLMGLEEIPPAPIQIYQKHFESEKMVSPLMSPRRPMFEIERPNAKKNSFLDENEDPKRRTLKEVIETMRLNGLLKSRNIDGFKLWSHFSPSHTKQRLDDEDPPIVIMKPMCLPGEKMEGKLSRQTSRNEGAIYLMEKLRKVKVREEPSIKKKSANEKNMGFDLMVEKLGLKDETPTKRKLKEAKTLDKSSSKVKASSVPPSHKPQKNMVVEKAEKTKKEIVTKKAEKPQKEIIKEKDVKTPKVSPIKKKSVEKEKEKLKTITKVQDQKKESSTRSRKSDDGTTLTHNCVNRQQSTTQDPALKQSVQSIPKSSIDQKKKSWIPRGNPLKKLKTATSPKTEPPKDIGVDIDRADEIDCSLTASGTLVTVSSSIKKEMEASKVDIKDHSGEKNSYICEIIDQHCTLAEPTDEVNQLIVNEPEPWKTSRPESPLKCFFLSSSSFLSHAEILFDLNINESIAAQQPTASTEDQDTMDARLIMKCATELMERKSFQVSEWDHPLLRTRIPNPRNNISIDKLVDEVCEGVENCRSYTYTTKPTDTFIKMLESDLMGKGMMVGGVWDLGWVNGLCVNEADHVVSEVGNQILDGLIQDVLQDFHDTWIQQLIDIYTQVIN